MPKTKKEQEQAYEVWHIVVKTPKAKVWLENYIEVRAAKEKDVHIDYAQSYKSYIEEQKIISKGE